MELVRCPGKKNMQFMKASLRECTCRDPSHLQTYNKATSSEISWSKSLCYVTKRAKGEKRERGRLFTQDSGSQNVFQEALGAPQTFSGCLGGQNYSMKKWEEGKEEEEGEEGKGEGEEEEGEGEEEGEEA